MEQRTTYITIRIDFSHDKMRGYNTEDICEMAGDIVVETARAYLPGKTNGISIESIDNCGVDL